MKKIYHYVRDLINNISMRLFRCYLWGFKPNVKIMEIDCSERVPWNDLEKGLIPSESIKKIEHLSGQIDMLAEAILKYCPEKIKGEGACGTAAEIIKEIFGDRDGSEKT